MRPVHRNIMKIMRMWNKELEKIHIKLNVSLINSLTCFYTKYSFTGAFTLLHIWITAFCFFTYWMTLVVNSFWILQIDHPVWGKKINKGLLRIRTGLWVWSTVNIIVEISRNQESDSLLIWIGKHRLDMYACVFHIYLLHSNTYGY